MSVLRTPRGLQVSVTMPNKKVFSFTNAAAIRQLLEVTSNIQSRTQLLAVRDEARGEEL
jgi:hypothetical protein